MKRILLFTYHFLKFPALIVVGLGIAPYWIGRLWFYLTPSLAAHNVYACWSLGMFFYIVMVTLYGIFFQGLPWLVKYAINRSKQ